MKIASEWPADLDALAREKSKRHRKPKIAPAKIERARGVGIVHNALYGGKCWLCADPNAPVRRNRTLCRKHKRQSAVAARKRARAAWESKNRGSRLEYFRGRYRTRKIGGDLA